VICHCLAVFMIRDLKCMFVAGPLLLPSQPPCTAGKTTAHIGHNLRSIILLCTILKAHQ
jgi:hypothetical protein